MEHYRIWYKLWNGGRFPSEIEITDISFEHEKDAKAFCRLFNKVALDGKEYYYVKEYIYKYTDIKEYKNFHKKELKEKEINYFLNKKRITLNLIDSDKMERVSINLSLNQILDILIHSYATYNQEGIFIDASDRKLMRKLVKPELEKLEKLKAELNKIEQSLKKSNEEKNTF